MQFTLTNNITRESGMRSPSRAGYKGGSSNVALKTLFNAVQKIFPNGQRPHSRKNLMG